jgi:hypothetical protein
MEKSGIQDDSKRFATIQHPLVQAVLGGDFRFALKEVALQRLKKFAQQFDGIYDDTNPDEPKVTLWIRGFGVDAHAERDGYLGNFAVVCLKLLEGRVYTIDAAKLDVPIDGHPIKRRPRQKHPNWGHPVLRNVRNETPYPSQQAARDDLARLHFEYPEVTIPAHEDKLLSIVYEKKAGEKPIKKYVFYIREAFDDDNNSTGEWRIKCKENIQGKPFTGGSKKAAMAASVMGQNKN